MMSPHELLADIQRAVDATVCPAIVELHPYTWEEMRLAVEPDGRYLIPAAAKAVPVTAPAPRHTSFSIPVSTNPDMPRGQWRSIP